MINGRINERNPNSTSNSGDGQIKLVECRFRQSLTGTKQKQNKLDVVGLETLIGFVEISKSSKISSNTYVSHELQIQHLMKKTGGSVYIHNNNYELTSIKVYL